MADKFSISASPGEVPHGVAKENREIGRGRHRETQILALTEPQASFYRGRERAEKSGTLRQNFLKSSMKIRQKIKGAGLPA